MTGYGTKTMKYLSVDSSKPVNATQYVYTKKALYIFDTKSIAFTHVLSSLQTFHTAIIQ